MSHEIRTGSHHGATWLTRLLYLFQGLFMVALGVVALWLIYSFPLWNHKEPVYKLPFEAVLHDAPDQIPDFVFDDAIERLDVEHVGAELRVVLANRWQHWLYTAIRSLSSHISIVGGSVGLDWAGELARGDFVTGWVMLILSEVFRRGAAMEEEQSLTV